MDSIHVAFTSSAFAWPLQFCLFSTIATYVASVITSNVSQVDRLWTFLPTIYTAYFALMPLWARPTGQPTPLIPFVPADLQLQTESQSWSPRALLLLGLITTWMFRLSYNTYRRGLFSLHDEDYRWAVLRAQLPPWLFQVVNLTFIAATQNVLLLTLGYPAYLALLQNDGTGKLVSTDIFFGIWALGVLMVEFTADNQQFVYQTYKHAFLDNSKKKSEPEAQAHANALSTASAVAWPFASPSPSSVFGLNLNLTPSDAHRGFLTKGLWGYSRHPNFACEQSFWWLMCLIPGLGSNSVLALDATNLSPQATETLSLLTGLVPAILLSILFFSSTAYTEAISKGKYPTAYAAYQKRVPMF
ncbi:DUF1295-domain-containing protein, partial [Gymnopus androsaceus JB14]